MPEGLFPEPKLVENIRELLLNRRFDEPYVSERYVKEKIAPLYPETEFIGKGTEYIVVGHPENSEKVVAFKYPKSFGHPLQALEIYHFHRFFNTLFPHNFPRFYASFGGEKPFTVREKIHSGYTKTVRYPFSEVKKTCKALGISLSVDDSKGNFIIGSDGGQYFIDTVKNINSSIFWEKFNANKLKSHMEKNGITGKREKVVWSSLRRLRELEVVFAGQCYIEEPDKIPEQWQSNPQEFWQELCTKEGFGMSDPQDIASRNRIIKTIRLFES